jgi:hypothetical protein
MRIDRIWANASDIAVASMGRAFQTSVMNDIESAVITIRRAILERFPPGPEREQWLAWLLAMRDSRKADRRRGITDG